jgi:ornithine carbamoyltransferase
VSFLGIADHGSEGLAEMLRVGAAVKIDRDSYRTSLAGRSIGLFFMKQSLRTWVSSEIGAVELGMHPLTIRDDQTGLGTREAPEDVGRVLDRYLDALAMRVHDHADLERLDAVMTAPVINLLSEREHPCQAVADLLTIADSRPLPGATVAYVGDGNNTCHSLAIGVTMTGGNVRIATPPGYEPDPAMLDVARAHGDVTVTHSPEEAVEGADAVYTDVWASMGQEDEAALRARAFEEYRVDEALFDRAADDAIFLHCLPAHRGEEVTGAVLDHPRSRVFDQAENRLHAFKAILLTELG